MDKNLVNKSFENEDYTIFIPDKLVKANTKKPRDIARDILNEIFGEGTKIFFNDEKDASVFFTPKQRQTGAQVSQAQPQQVRPKKRPDVSVGGDPNGLVQ